MRILLLLACALPLWSQTAIDLGAQAKSAGQPVTLVLFFSGTGAPAPATCPATPTARLYMDTAASRLYYCSPTGWQSIPLAVPTLVPHTDTFAPATTSTLLSSRTYVASSAPSGDVQVFVNGLLVDTPGDYTLAGQTVTFTGTTGAIQGATVKLHYWTAGTLTGSVIGAPAGAVVAMALNANPAAGIRTMTAPDGEQYFWVDQVGNR